VFLGDARVFSRGPWSLEARSIYLSPFWLVPGPISMLSFLGLTALLVTVIFLSFLGLLIAILLLCINKYISAPIFNWKYFQNYISDNKIILNLLSKNLIKLYIYWQSSIFFLWWRRWWRFFILDDPKTSLFIAFYDLIILYLLLIDQAFPVFSVMFYHCLELFVKNIWNLTKLANVFIFYSLYWLGKLSLSD